MAPISHDEYLAQCLGEKVDYDWAYWHQCVDYVRRYCEKVLEPIWNFNWSALNGRNSGSPFNSKWKRVKNSANAVPPKGAIIFFDKTPTNQYGHVAVVDTANTKAVAVAEQNWGNGTGTGNGTDSIRLQTYNYLSPKCLGRFVYTKK